MLLPVVVLDEQLFSYGMCFDISHDHGQALSLHQDRLCILSGLA